LEYFYSWQIQDEEENEVLVLTFQKFLKLKKYDVILCLESWRSVFTYWRALSAIYFILMIYCLVDVIKSEFKDSNMKLIWIIIILFAQLIGTLVYLILGKSTKSLTQLENSVPINQVKSIISIYFSGPKGV
jgi:hypothetical protein